MRSIQLETELDSVLKLRTIWLEEQRLLHEMVENCTAEKTTPPPGYWEKENRAYERYRAALAVYAVLEEQA